MIKKSLDPFTLIEANGFADREKEKERPEIILESGISNRKCEKYLD